MEHDGKEESILLFKKRPDRHLQPRRLSTIRPIDTPADLEVLFRGDRWASRGELPFHGKIALLLAAYSLLAAVCSAAGSPDGEVLPPGISVRQGPAFTTPIVAELPAGTKVEILFTQRGPDGDWAQLALPSGKTGFVPSRSLQQLTAPPRWTSVDKGSRPQSAARRMGDGVLEMPLRRVGGVFLVSARINSQVTTNFIVDSGASIVTISHTLADRLGLEYENKPKQRIATASGFMESPQIVLDSIYVPDESGVGVANVQAHVATLPGSPPGIAGLLGQSFLRNFQVTIDAEKATMSLRPIRP